MADDPANELMAFFGVDGGDCTPFVYLPRGAQLEAQKGAPHKLAPKDAGELEAWFTGLLGTPSQGFRLKNDLDHGVTVLLETYPGEKLCKQRLERAEIHKEETVMELAPGEEKQLDTAVGQTLVWRKHRGPDDKPWDRLRLLARSVITDAAVAAKGVILSELLAGPGNNTEVLQLTDEDASTWRSRVRSNLKRMLHTEIQPLTVSPFTKVGFEHTRTPQALQERLLAFLTENEDRREADVWQVRK